MKRKTAREILADSFRELAETKSVDKITVRDIADNCGYSSATFYRQFKDKYDLIAWQYTQGVADIMDRIGVDNCRWEQILPDASGWFFANREFLSNLLLHTSGHDSFIRYMTEIDYNALKKYILEANALTALDEKTDMYIRTFCMGTASVTCEWILGRYHVSPEELAEIYKNALPSPLLPLLLPE